MTIEAENIVARLNGKTVLDGVSLTLSPGEMVGLIGPNGAGKTTLLRLMAGIAMPQRGKVRYDGRDISQLDFRTRALARAYLAQSDDVQIPLKVERLVALGRAPYTGVFGRETRADVRAIERAMSEADVSHLRSRAFNTLSGGERRRVLLARALCVEAPLLLADEPVAALDPAHQLAVMGLLAASRDRGAGVLVILHDLTLAARFCDRLALMDRGKLVAVGRPAEVLNDDRLRATYGIEVLHGMQGGVPWLLPWALANSRNGGAENNG
ncbi:MAG: ABC transporter ATP-binding protein [Parvibaculaceae bacterium]|nr:ABC transporter ATP-binding protein [Parvibaculaceae bacterium]